MNTKPEIGTKTPAPELPPDPLDPIVSRGDALTLNRAISTAPALLTDADLGYLVESLRRDRARFNQAEKQREENREGAEDFSPADPMDPNPDEVGDV